MREGGRREGGETKSSWSGEGSLEKRVSRPERVKKEIEDWGESRVKREGSK